MIEYLEKLVEEKEYQKALDYAEQLLLNPDNTAWDLMMVYSHLLQVRFALGEFYGAQVAGQLAVKMALELKAWDYYGMSTLWLGTCYDRLGQTENALTTWYDYVSNVHFYKDALKYHVVVLYNIGIVQAKIGHYEESVCTLQKAADVAKALNDHRKTHGIRHALIDVHLRSGKLEQVPRLLAKCAYYLRYNNNVNDYTQSRLWHLVLRVRFALATNRPHRAVRVAERGLKLAKDWPDIAYELHLLKARANELAGNTRLAIEQALSARNIAMECRRFDLEYAAANYIYGLVSSHLDLRESWHASSSIGAWDPSAIR